MRSNSSAGHSGVPAATSVMPPISNMRIGAVDAPQRAKLVHLLDEAAQISIHSYRCNHPAIHLETRWAALKPSVQARDQLLDGFDHGRWSLVERGHELLKLSWGAVRHIKFHLRGFGQ